MFYHFIWLDFFLPHHCLNLLSIHSDCHPICCPLRILLCRKISAVELNGHHDDQDSSHELSWLSPTKHCQFQSQYPHSDASRLSSSSTHTNSSSATEVQHSRFSSGNTHASYPSSDLSLSSSPPTLYSSHLPGWALEPDSKQANNRHNNCLNLTDKRALQNGIDPSVSIATVGDDRAHPAW